MFKRFTCFLVLFYAVALPVKAQEFPSKPVRIVIGFAAGGSVDLVGRLLGKGLSELWGQPVIIENKLGAGGTIAADFVAKAPPDGYTLLLGDISNTAVAKSLFKILPYDPLNDFTHVTRLVSFPLVIVVPSSSSINGFSDLLVQAKASPGKFRYSTGGPGTSPHIFLEMMNQMGGIRTDAVHYKGSAPAIAGLLSGDIEFSASSIPTAKAQIDGGRVRAIAVTGKKAVSSMPNVPPIAAHINGYEALAFHGLHAPARTPVQIIQKLNADSATVMQRSDIKRQLEQGSMDVSTMSSSEFTLYMSQQIDQWARVVATGKIQAD